MTYFDAHLRNNILPPVFKNENIFIFEPMFEPIPPVKMKETTITSFTKHLNNAALRFKNSRFGSNKLWAVRAAVIQ